MPILVASLLAAGNLFAPPPSNPGLNDPLPANSPPPLPRPGRRRPATLLPKRQQPSKSPPAPSHPRNAPNSPRRSRAPPSPNPALKATHSRTRYFKPVPEGGVLPADDGSGRAVVIGPSGLSYRLPGAPFEFQFSYSEAPKAKPIAIREPAFLPFAPPTMNRPWTGKAPLLSKKEKERKKKVRLFEPLGQTESSEDDEEEEEEEEEGGGKVMYMNGNMVGLGRYPEDGRSREEILGAPLKRWEIRELIKPCLSSNKQVNLGRDGLTHNMLELIHSHWRRQQVCKVRCRGVPTVDMDNVCHHLEEKTGGKVIHRAGGVAYLFRGRHYDPRTRPRYPIMLWKPAAPVYPKLIQEAPEGLTKAEADELRKKGENLLPICKLAKNGIYVDLVKDVKDAFEGSELVKVNCEGMHASDYKKLGAKLKELVPCVLLSFDNEQILMWRGKEWKSSYKTPLTFDSMHDQFGDHDSSHQNVTGQSGVPTGESKIVHKKLSQKMLSLWKRAVESEKALFLDDTPLDPDSLLQRVEEFEALTQASKHSYQALILSSQGDPNGAAALGKSIVRAETNVVYNRNDSEVRGKDEYDRGLRYDDKGVNILLDEIEPSVPFGHLTIDSITEEHNRDC